MLIGEQKRTRILCRSRVMTRAFLPRFPPFFSRFYPFPLSLSLFPFFLFFSFSPSRAFVLACLYTGHAFPRNGSAYELRARWEYGMGTKFLDGSWEKQQYEIPGKSSACMRAEFIYMNFNKTCLYSHHGSRDNVFFRS